MMWISQDADFQLQALLREKALRDHESLLFEATEKGRRESLAEGHRAGLAEGHQEGEVALLAKLIEKRFGPLPPEVQQRLQEAQSSELERWGITLLEAQTLEQLFQ